jgi:hypothetical protein
MSTAPRRQGLDMSEKARAQILNKICVPFKQHQSYVRLSQSARGIKQEQAFVLKQLSNDCKLFPQMKLSQLSTIG